MKTEVGRLLLLLLLLMVVVVVAMAYHTSAFRKDHLVVGRRYILGGLFCNCLPLDISLDFVLSRGTRELASFVKRSLPGCIVVILDVAWRWN